MKDHCSLRPTELLRSRLLATSITLSLLVTSSVTGAFAQRGADPSARRRPSDATSRRGSSPAPPATNRIPLKLAPINQPNGACANVIVDGGFETGGIPSSTWDPETSTNFGTPLCNVPSCGTGGGSSPPRTGAVWTWFGGIPAPETATIGQTVNIAASSEATLNFWMRIGTVSSPFTDVLNVRVDGAIVQSFPEPTVAEGAYTLRSINLNAFANGANHQILFEYIGPTTGTGSYVVDDVTLDVCGTTPVPAGTLLISEFRLIGPAGIHDEFIEIYNNSGSAHTVSGAYGVAASDGVLRCTIPNGTTIPNRGHFLCANNTATTGYSLGTYPSGNNGSVATTATPDATYTADIPETAGIGLFSSTTNFTAGTKIDAVGPAGEANALYKEGPGYPSVTTGLAIEQTLFRKISFSSGLPSDTDNNATDFAVAATNANASQPVASLGAPGPENLTSPIIHNDTVKASLIFPCNPGSASPNRIRTGSGNSGSLSIRRKFTNNTGASVTRLRFRIIDLTTSPAPNGSTAILAATTSSSSVEADPCGGPAVAIEALTLETPPAQALGGGYNSSLTAGTITLGTPLTNSATINVNFLLNISQAGTFRFFVVVEALP